MCLALLAALTLTARTTPYYDRLELHQLVLGAERVVAGTISAVHETTYELVVERDLLGGPPGTTLRVERFVDWTCASRWDAYRAGQRVVLFLREGRAMGGGDEGDWPIVGERVLAPYGIRDVEQVEHRFREPSWSPFSGAALALDELARAVTGARACFETFPEIVDGREWTRVRFALDEAAALAFAATSPLARHVYEDALSSHAFARDVVPALPPLAVEPLARVRGDAGVFAYALASPGDVDGDGIGDLAVREDGVWILRLGAAGEVLARNRIERAVLGPRRHVQQVAATGDVDGDGVPDLAVAASGEEDEPGCLALLRLSRDGTLKESRVLDPGRPVDGDGQLALAGDVDRDGRPELVLALPPAMDLAASLRGERTPHLLSLLFLGEGGALVRTREIDSREIHGQVSDVTFGDSLAELGDLDGDGGPELAIGHAYDDDGGDCRGAVHVVSFARDGSTRWKTKISDWSGSFESLLLDGDELGRTLAAPGDLDGDGVPDLVVAGARELWILHLERDGRCKRFAQRGPRAGGFVDVERILSLAVVRGPGAERRLAVGARTGKHGEANALWLLRLDADGVSAP